MKNKVYGLKSMVVYPSGEIERDGTLLFPNKEKADKFMAFVTHIASNTEQKPAMKGTNRSLYEHDQEYLVTPSIADFVNSRNSFFVRRISMHIVEETVDYQEVLDATKDAETSADNDAESK